MERRQRKPKIYTEIPNLNDYLVSSNGEVIKKSTWKKRKTYLRGTNTYCRIVINKRIHVINVSALQKNLQEMLHSKTLIFNSVTNIKNVTENNTRSVPDKLEANKLEANQIKLPSGMVITRRRPISKSLTTIPEEEVLHNNSVYGNDGILYTEEQVSNMNIIEKINLGIIK